jgi:hypothetical protein
VHEPDTIPFDAARGPRPGPSTAIELLLADYVHSLESGAEPQLRDFLARLTSDDERRQFVDLLDQLSFADRHLPLRLRAQVVLNERYELLEPIGAGGMGRVWRAMDHKLGHEVAIKVLSLVAMASIDLDHLLEREGKLLAKLSHPGVVRVQDMGRDGEHRFLVMELVGGLALDDLVDRLQARRADHKQPLVAADLLRLVGPTPAGRSAVLAGDEPWPVAVTKILVEVLRTLEATHGVGVVHRDLKPGNVRITGGGYPVLLDFGISFVAGSTPGKMTAELFGTAQYSAPEQWQGKDNVGTHTDVYQAGLVLYELLTLHRCFTGESPIETMRAVRDARYQKPRELDRSIDPALEACVLRAMDVDPARRYATATAFREDLECCLRGEIPAAAAKLTTVSRQLRLFGRRHRGGLSLAAAALVGALGLWLVRGEPAPGVQWVSARTMAVDLADPATMVAFRIARDVGGACYCAPVFLGAPDLDPIGGTAPALGFARGLPAGRSEVSMYDVGDGSQFTQSMVSTVFVAPDDASAQRRFTGLVQAMQSAHRLIVDRNGEWLPEAEFRSLFAAGRGGSSVEVPIERLFADGEWNANGLRGRVVAPPPGP